MTMQDDFSSYGQALAVGDAAPDLTLRDEDGQETTLAAFWRQRATALVFIRHFG